MFTQQELSQLINATIERIDYPDLAPKLFEPVQYMLSSGGKRVRPCLVLMAANLFSDDIQPALTPAVGLEIYHNFTLLHDDVMDKAPERHGKPTVHLKWNENSAILSGDAMQALAYTYIATVPTPVLRPVIEAFNKMNVEIGEGQQLDIDFETRQDVTADEYIQMIRLKTSVLLGCALRMGGLIGRQLAIDSRNGMEGKPEDIDLLYTFGENVGLAFQLQDDWLDCWGDPATFGKRIGGDILCNKKTYLLIHALQMADGKNLETLLQEINPKKARMGEEEKIEFFKKVYAECGAESACRKAIEYYQATALDALNHLSIDRKRTKALSALAQSLTHRKK